MSITKTITCCTLGLAMFTISCSPAIMLPPVQEPLDSKAWENCANEAAAREGSSLIDDMTMDSKSLLCKGVAMASGDGDVDDAIEVLYEAAVHDKGDARPYFMAGRILTEEGRFEEALTAFARAHKRSEGLEVPAGELGHKVLKLKGDAEAIRFLEMTVERKVCDYGCKNLLAQLYQRNERSGDALALFEGMREEAPEKPAAYVGLASIRSDENNHEEESALLSAAIKSEGFKSLSDAEQAPLHYNLAFSYYNGENYKAAKDEIATALLLKQEPEWWLLFGRILLRMEDPAVAIIKFDKAIGMDNNLAPAYTGKGDAQLVLGQLDDALDSYKRAAYLQPGDAVIKLKYARACVRDGDMDKAKTLLADAEKLDKENLPPQMHAEVTSALAAAAPTN